MLIIVVMVDPIFIYLYGFFFPDPNHNLSAGCCNGKNPWMTDGCYGICNVYEWRSVRCHFEHLAHVCEQCMWSVLVCPPVWVIFFFYRPTGKKLDGEAQLWRLSCPGQAPPSVYLWPALFSAPWAAPIWQLEGESRGKELGALPTLRTIFKPALGF